jgi:hypothetical protein
MTTSRMKIDSIAIGYKNKHRYCLVNKNQPKVLETIIINFYFVFVQ